LRVKAHANAKKGMKGISGEKMRQPFISLCWPLLSRRWFDSKTKRPSLNEGWYIFFQFF